jgi:L-ascorbate metabolism protein UlaG (beta-lactamase superfamily)
MACKRALRHPVSDHYNGRRFFNQNPHALAERGFWSTMKWMRESRSLRKPWPAFVPNTAEPNLPEAVGPGEAHVTCVSHATNLVQMQGLAFLTDPVFSERASPFAWAGPKRARAPGVALEDLPKLDAVLISHNHYDHFDAASVKALWAAHQPLFVVPLGDGKLLRRLGVERIVELDWWQSAEIPGGSRVWLTPARHWSGRWLHDRSRSLWGGFVVQAGGVQLYFAGDTGYDTHFEQTRDRFGPMDVSVLPIGAYAPRWFMRGAHMNPDDAVRAHLDLGSAMSVATHFGTFQLTDEGIDEPVLDLAKALAERGVDPSLFVPPEHGQTVFFRKSTASARQASPAR